MSLPFDYHLVCEEAYRLFGRPSLSSHSPDPLWMFRLFSQPGSQKQGPRIQFVGLCILDFSAKFQVCLFGITSFEKCILWVHFEPVNWRWVSDLFRACSPMPKTDSTEYLYTSVILTNKQKKTRKVAGCTPALNEAQNNSSCCCCTREH